MTIIRQSFTRFTIQIPPPPFPVSSRPSDLLPQLFACYTPGAYFLGGSVVINLAFQLFGFHGVTIGHSLRSKSQHKLAISDKSVVYFYFKTTQKQNSLAIKGHEFFHVQNTSMYIFSNFSTANILFICIFCLSIKGHPIHTEELLIFPQIKESITEVYNQSSNLTLLSQLSICRASGF